MSIFASRLGLALVLAALCMGGRTAHAQADTLKYNTGIGSPFAPFDTASGTLPGYSAHAGVEFQPAPNVSLSLGFGYTQQSGRIDSDINSLSLPGASPFAVNGRR